MSRKRVVRRIKESGLFDGLDLSLLDILTVRDVCKNRKCVYRSNLDEIQDVMVGVLMPNVLNRDDYYYAIKTFLKFGDESASLPCIVLPDCLTPCVVNSEVIVVEWNFIYVEKRKDLDVFYLEITKMLTLSDSLLPEEGLVGCSSSKEGSKLLNSEDEALSDTRDILGKVHAVSEVYETPGEEGGGFYVWLEDIEHQNMPVIIACRLKVFFWIQGWLRLEKAYSFKNVRPSITRSGDRAICCFEANERFAVASMENAPESCGTKLMDMSRGLGLDLKDLITKRGTVTEAKDSHFGKFIIDYRTKVYMHACGGGNYEHVHEGCEVVLENISQREESFVGGPVSRLLIASFPSNSPRGELDPTGQDDLNFGLDLEGFKPFRILSELVGNSSSMSPVQLDNLLRDIAIPHVILCPALLSSLNYKTYIDLFNCRMLKPRDQGLRSVMPNCPDAVVSVPINRVSPQRKIEDFVCGRRSCAVNNELVKLLTIQDLLENLDGERFEVFEKSQDYWECRIADNTRTEEPYFLIGILKRDDQRACLSLVDSRSYIECVVTDIAEVLHVHSCHESPSCRLLCHLTWTPSQVASCPFAHPAHIDCLIRVDRFFLVSETFSAGPSLPFSKSFEKRYLVFSAVDIALLGPHDFVEMGLTYFPSRPPLEDARNYGNLNFSPSEWSHFSFLPSVDWEDDKVLSSRFGYECFILNGLLGGCDDFSYEGFARFANEGDGKSNACSCQTSLVFLVACKDGPLAFVRRPMDGLGDFDPLEFMNECTREADRARNERPVGSDEECEPEVPYPSREDDEVAVACPPLNWDLDEKLVPRADPSKTKFVGGKQCYRFTLNVFVLSYADEVCGFCRKNENAARRSHAPGAGSELPGFEPSSKEILLVFMDECAGWFPTFRHGCVYELEARAESCHLVRSQLSPHGKEQTDSESRWSHILEFAEIKGLSVKRSYRDWFGSASEDPPEWGTCRASTNLLREVFEKFSSSSEFVGTGRIELDEQFETLVGVVVMKRFNQARNSTGGARRLFGGERSTPRIEYSLSTGCLLPGWRTVVVTLQLMGTDETVKVSVPGDANHKYALGVLAGSCVRFSRVLRTKFLTSGRKACKLYSFVSESCVEVLRFPDDPFSGSPGGDPVAGVRFFSRKLHRIEPEEQEPSQASDSRRHRLHEPSEFSVSCTTLLRFVESQESQDPLESAFSAPRRFLRDLLYDNSLEFTADVYVNKVSLVEVYFACARHPDGGLGPTVEPSCKSCFSTPTLFRARLKMEVCDSTCKSYITCCDQLARRVLDLSEPCWKELGELVERCPGKRVCWSYVKERQEAEGGGLVSDVETFLDVLARSEHVQRRLLVTGTRFRTVLNPDGSKSFDIRHGPRPLGHDRREVGSNPGLRDRSNVIDGFVRSLKAVEDTDAFLPALNLELKDFVPL